MEAKGQTQKPMSPKCQNVDFYHLPSYRAHVFPLSHAALPYGCKKGKVEMFIGLMFRQLFSQENEKAEMRTSMMKWLPTHMGGHRW